MSCTQAQVIMAYVSGGSSRTTQVAIELLQALDGFGVDQITKFLNDIFDTGQLPENLIKSIFITHPKKAEAVANDFCRTIHLKNGYREIYFGPARPLHKCYRPYQSF